MITEIEGVVIEGDNVHIVLVDDEEGTIELEMSSETFKQLKQAAKRARKRSKA